ncbi:MAG: TRAP transporter small permease, partial [Pseudomonadota bacterium]
MAMRNLDPAQEDLLRRDAAGADDAFSAVDHLSRFSGLAVAQLYLMVAAVTVWEVVARYVFHAPTTWAFEIVMVLCAIAWMISAGYVTLQKRHIGITVFYLMAGERTRWSLDLFAMVVGVLALFLLADDALVRSLASLTTLERAGTAFNSPEPAMLKTALVIGVTLYLIQLLVNLHR